MLDFLYPPLEWRDWRDDWPLSRCSQFANSAGLRWHYQKLGQGPVMLLLHGTGASTHTWRDLVPLWASTFTVVSVDLPGHAFTPDGAWQHELEASFPYVETDDQIRAIREVKDALVRLPYAALLGTVLALRPRKKSLGRRSVAVVQTQIMLSVVGAVIMLVVGNSLSRAFGIVGAAVGALSSSTSGRNLNLVLIVIFAIRLSLGGGIF